MPDFQSSTQPGGGPRPTPSACENICPGSQPPMRFLVHPWLCDIEHRFIRLSRTIPYGVVLSAVGRHRADGSVIVARAGALVPGERAALYIQTRARVFPTALADLKHGSYAPEWLTTDVTPLATSSGPFALPVTAWGLLCRDQWTLGLPLPSAAEPGRGPLTHGVVCRVCRRGQRRARRWPWRPSSRQPRGAAAALPATAAFGGRCGGFQVAPPRDAAVWAGRLDGGGEEGGGRARREQPEEEAYRRGGTGECQGGGSGA